MTSPDEKIEIQENSFIDNEGGMVHTFTGLIDDTKVAYGSCHGCEVKTFDSIYIRYYSDVMEKILSKMEQTMQNEKCKKARIVAYSTDPIPGVQNSELQQLLLDNGWHHRYRFVFFKSDYMYKNF